MFDAMRRGAIVNRLLAAIPLAGVAGCNVPQMVTPYRMEIQQGNFITQDMIAQLKPGMTRDQVRFVLGTPLLVDPFHADRWDYVFTRALEYNRGYEQRRITVYFDKAGTLERVAGDVVAPQGGAPASPAASAAPVVPNKAADPAAGRTAQQETK